MTRGHAGTMPLVVIGLILPLGTGCTIGWETDFERGIQRANQTRRPALVHFYSPLDEACREMENEVFSNQDIQAKLEQYVKVRLDYGWNEELAKELGVFNVPAFLVFRPDGSLAAFRVGKMNTDQFNVFLIKYRYY